VIGANPECDAVLRAKCYPDLKSIPKHVDVVDIFRKPGAVTDVVDQAIGIGVGALWMQLGLENEQAAQKARRADLGVVMNKCTKIEHSRLPGSGTACGLPKRGD
jgi:predicted CoA-binding protein